MRWELESAARPAIGRAIQRMAGQVWVARPWGASTRGLWHVLIVLALALSGCAPVPSAQAMAPGAAEMDALESAPRQGVQGDGPLQRLWIDLSMGPQLVDWFNQNARPDDIARADHISLIDMLEPVQTGQRLVVFKTVPDAEQLMPRIGDKLDIIGYNLEHGPSNRPDEQQDPVGSIRRMREIADEYGKQLAFGPDRNFAISHGAAMAPYADIFVLQVQRVQTEPFTVRDFVIPMVEQLRRANPDIQISVQVRTDGDPAQIIELLTSLEPYLDGISILTSPETIDIAEQLVKGMRPAPPVVTSAPPTPGTVQTTPAASAAQPESTGAPGGFQAGLPTSPVPTPVRRGSANPTPVAPSPAAPPANEAMPFRFMLLAGLIALGVVLTGLLGTVFIYSLRKLRGQ